MSILNVTLGGRQSWDWLGIGASTLCVLHCLVTPLLVVALPMLEVYERQTHATFALTILGLGLLAFWPGFLKHRRVGVVAIAVLGFGLISLGVTAPEGVLTEAMEKVATVAGGAMLVFAHLRNVYFCRFCPTCGGQDC
jgi:hypothetical protein